MIRERTKSFDCVTMKTEVQAKLRQDFAGLSDEEERTRITQELESSDDVVARKWRRIREKNPAAR